MPNPGTVFDGFDSMVSADSDTHPSYLPPQVAAEQINRQDRGGIDRQRNRFVEMQLEATDPTDTAILEDYALGNWQGGIPYKAVNYDTNDGIICALGGSVFFLTIVNDRFLITRLYSGRDKGVLHNWFVQAEDQVYNQNGRNNPLVWNGVVGSPMTELNPFSKQMPIGTVMEYSNGRVFVCDPFDRIFASDIIFGSGFTNTQNTRNFTETEYWAEGGSFTAPSNLGRLTGMKVMPTLNLNDKGQGELVCFYERGAFTLNTSVPRTSWKDAQIQKVSMIGRGNLSPWSITGVNNEIFFRSPDGWSAYNNSQMEFSSKLSFRKLSREVNRWVDQDTIWMRQFASGAFFDNRFIGTVSPFLVRPAASRPDQGLHRPHRGMVVLDLDQGSGSAPDAQIGFRWNGLWSGPQPTQIIKAFIRGQERCFFFSFDQDGRNRIYELKTNPGDDYAMGVNKPVVSETITKRFDFSGSQETSKFIRKEITGGKFSVSGISGFASIEVAYRPDDYPCWTTIMEETQLGCQNCEPAMAAPCEPLDSQNRFKNFSMPSPKTNICQVGTKIPTVSGFEFQYRIRTKGSMAINRLRLSAATKGNQDDPVGLCPSEPDCSPISCCPDNGIFLYRIIE